MPQLAPYIAAAARSDLSLVWKIVLIVELLDRPNGVGFEIGVAFQLFDVTRILAYALAFVAVMLAIETLLVQPLERHVARWRPSHSLRSRSRHKAFSAALGGHRDVLSGLKLRLGYGEVGALLGPSGCGKTTGAARSSQASTATTTASCSCPHHGRLGVMFQEPRLLPWRTVEDNVRLAAPEATGRRARPRCSRALGAFHPPATTFRASSRSASPAASPWRAPLRSSLICCCSTSPSCRSTGRWRRSSSRHWPTWYRATR